MKKQLLTLTSITLNIIFFCIILFLGYKFYPKMKSKFDREKIKTTAIKETEIKQNNALPTVWFDASKFKIIGKLPGTDTYSRLPESAKKEVTKIIWDLSQNTAGLSIRFKSNSSSVKLKWSLRGNGVISSMTAIASKGFDLYCFINGKWQFAGVAMPGGNIKNESEIITGMDTREREYLLNLPLYEGLKSVEIGIDKGANITEPAREIIKNDQSIIFYGTSITQGASASRPGLTYPSRLQREFNNEVINLGFSGNGKFEKIIGKYIMSAKPKVIVLDCTPNSSAQTIEKNLPQLVDYIRSKNKTVPIVFMESIIRDFAYLKKDDKKVSGTMSYIKEQNSALTAVYREKSKKHRFLYYLDSRDLIGNDHEATIDGTHFNDIGHYRAYNYLKLKLGEIIKP